MRVSARATADPLPLWRGLWTMRSHVCRARLCDGFLDSHEIECPLHRGKFDVRSGTPTRAPATEARRSYPVRSEGRRVVLQID